MMRAFSVWISFFTQGVFVTILFVSCNETSDKNPTSAIYNVDFLNVQPGSAAIERQYPGLLEGSENVAIKSQATGYLDHIYVKEGDYVQKGQSLFRIKADVYREQVNNARAAYQMAQAAEKNAGIELDKVRPLVAAKVYSELMLKTAEAALTAAKAQAAQARSALASSQLNEAFALIKAPVSGYTGRMPNRIGNLVSPSDAVPLTTVSDIDQMYVYFSLVEADFIDFLRDKKEGISSSSAALIMADGSVYEHPGNVEIASGNIDRSTGSISLKAIFPNKDRLLRAGGSGRIILKKKLDHVITIPMGSVKDIQDRFFVFVLGKDNKVSMLSVEVSGTSDNRYIISSGLKAGDNIALNRIDALNDGMQVDPTVLTSSIVK